MPETYPFPVARIGIIGGGQLGRMMVMAAHRLGCTCVVLDPYHNSPAGQLAGHQIVGNFDDSIRLRELVESCDVTTFDLEDIDTDVLSKLEKDGQKIYPNPATLSVVQDKLSQKRLFEEAGILTADFIAVDGEDLAIFADFGFPLVQKARRGGYDGKGVVVMHSAQDFNQHIQPPSLIERFIEAEKELAVMVARGQDGTVKSYPVVEMVFDGRLNVLDRLLAPARIAPDLAKAAQALAEKTVEALNGVGIFGVELFLSQEGALLVNEVAPRTHNSGHYTIEASITDQFEQHLRAVLGLPLGDTDLMRSAVMLNLLGEPGYKGRPVISGLNEALALPGVAFHWYGKAETRPGRKMGHVTILGSTIDNACATADKVQALIKVSGEERV